MKKLIIIVIMFIFSFRFGNGQWIVQQISPSSTGVFTSIKFVNMNTGYATGQDYTSSIKGFLYKTTNGGDNWINLTLPAIMNTFLWQLEFVDVNTGFVTGHSTYIFKTTDGGYNWSYSIAPYAAYSAIKFFNSQRGFIGGSDGMLATTTNSGVNWITLDTAYADILDFYFFNENTGFFVDTYHGIYKTTNGFSSWSYNTIFDTSSGHYGYGLNSIKFINSKTGYIVGAKETPRRGAIFKTTDGGNIWKSILITIDNPLYSLAIVDSTAIYVGGYEKIIYKSTDDGKTWVGQQIQSYLSSIYSIFFVNRNTGYCCAGNAIMKTTNGGIFVNKISSEIPSEIKLFQNYPNPFNFSTIIKYQISKRKFITIKVFDIIGKEIIKLVQEKQSPGIYEVNLDGSNLSTGIYFYMLYTNEKLIDTKKLTLIK